MIHIENNTLGEEPDTKSLKNPLKRIIKIEREKNRLKLIQLINILGAILIIIYGSTWLPSTHSLDYINFVFFSILPGGLLILGSLLIITERYIGGFLIFAIGGFFSIMFLLRSMSSGFLLPIFIFLLPISGFILSSWIHLKIELISSSSEENSTEI